MSQHRVVIVALVVFGGFSATAGAQGLSRAEAESAAAKLGQIDALSKAASSPERGPATTSFTDREINSYLMFYGSQFLPSGITDPRVAFGDRSHVQARGIVDLGAVSRSQERDWFDPLAYVTGSLEVIASGYVAGANGEGVVRFESATVGGVSVPKVVLQEILRFYTRTPERPRGFAFDEPFVLPANIHSFATERHRAIVVQ